MKIQSVVFLTAVLMLTTLVAESECIGAGAVNGKREYQEKVAKRLLTVSTESQFGIFKKS